MFPRVCPGTCKPRDTDEMMSSAHNIASLRSRACVCGSLVRMIVGGRCVVVVGTGAKSRTIGIAPVSACSSLDSADDEEEAGEASSLGGGTGFRAGTAVLAGDEAISDGGENRIPSCCSGSVFGKGSTSVFEGDVLDDDASSGRTREGVETESLSHTIIAVTWRSSRRVDGPGNA